MILRESDVVFFCFFFNSLSRLRSIFHSFLFFSDLIGTHRETPILPHFIGKKKMLCLYSNVAKVLIFAASIVDLKKKLK